MANPPPVRPWFRLASIRSNPAPFSAPAPGPAPGPAPAPAPSQPPQEPRTNLPFRTASAPSSPQTQPPQEPSSQPNKSSSSLPTSPVQKATVTTSSPEKKNNNDTRVPTPSPTHSPKIIKQSERSPMHSPKTNNINKPTAPPPSPLTLPPSQLKPEPNIPEQPEPKTVLVQKTIDRPKPSHNNHTSESHKNQNNGHQYHHGKQQQSGSKEKGGHRKHSESEESGMRVITIAGENRGAYMELIQSPKKHEAKYLHKKGNSNVNVDGVESENLSGEEGNVNKNHKGRTTSSFPMAAYMNSNVQCVNNSLLYHTSCSHHDPGVRLSLSKKPFGEGFHVKEHAQSHHA